jgi:hypothetical protein
MEHANSRFSRPRDFAERVRWDLAVLRGQDRGDLLAPLIDQVADAEHDLGALRDRRCAPRDERVLGGTDSSIDLLDRGKVDRLRLAPGRRVVDRALAAGRALDHAAVDPMVDAA